MADPHALRGGHPHFRFDEDWLALHVEDPIDPDLPIVDAHHHLWDRGQPYWHLDMLRDMQAGHNIRATVYVEAGSMYRQGDTSPFAALGEVEFANGIGAAFASGYYGDQRMCAGIVGRANLALPEVEDFLLACISRAPVRFRGIRQIVAQDDDPAVSRPSMPIHKDQMLEPAFQRGFAAMARLGLSFDVLCYHPQLPQLLMLVDTSPETVVVLNHCGLPVGQGRYANARQEVFADWLAAMKKLAERPNVYVKLGGLTGRVAGFPFLDRDIPAPSEVLAEAWRPYISSCIEVFGSSRTMFESNLPPEKSGCAPVTLWNAFKRIAGPFTTRSGLKRAIAAHRAVKRSRTSAFSARRIWV